MQSENQLKNLKPFDENQDREEAKKNGRKGGVASGIARRKKAAARKAFAEVMAIVPTFDPRNEKDARTIRSLEKYGITDLESVDLQLLSALSLMNKATTGHTGAIRLMMEIVGEDAASQIQKQKLALDRERLALERERLALERERMERENSASCEKSCAKIILAADGGIEVHDGT